VATQVHCPLKFSSPLLDEIFGGTQSMFESQLLKRAIAQRLHETILALLKDRFDTVPQKVTKPLRAILDDQKLLQLYLLAAN
jgi:hypothetical protein